MSHVARTGLLSLTFSLMAGCCFMGIGCKEPSATTLSQALKSCASSDMIATSSILYTGPTGAGPGAFWVQINEKPPTYAIGALPKDIFGDPLPTNLFAPLPTVGTCAFNSNSTLNLTANLGASVTALPLSATAQADLKNATVMNVTAQGLAWDSVLLQNYNLDLNGSPNAAKYFQPNVWVALGMLKVQGYVAKLDVSNVHGVDLGAKYNGPLPAATTGNLSAAVTASYNNASTLTLTIPGETYIAGVFGRLDAATGQVVFAHPPGRASEPTIDTASIQGDRK